MTKRRPPRASKPPAKPDARLVEQLAIHKVGLHLHNEELRESRDETESLLVRYREVFELAPIGYVMLEGSDTIEEINHAGAELLGVPVAFLLGKRFGAFLAPQSMAAFHAILSRAAADGRPARGELDLWRDGAAVSVRVHATRLQRSPMVMLAFEDISERKQQERELARTEHALREEVRRKDEFLAMLSHELRNPLAPLRTSVSILEIVGMPSQSAREALEIIARSSAHLARLVDDLLDITRISRGKIRLRKQPVDLNELVRRVLAEHAATIANHGLAAEERLTSESLTVDGDPDRLLQVVSNLVGNAEKLTPATGKITITTEAHQGRALIHVLDTGIGIAPEVIDTRGVPFVQAPQAIDRSRGGLGIGASVPASPSRRRQSGR